MLKVACVQFRSIIGNIQGNLMKAIIEIKEAKKKGAELVVLPELFNVGYDFSVFKDMDYDFSQTLEILSNTAYELNIYIAAGLLEVKDDNWYNSLLVFDNTGKVCATYRKICLFPLSNEEMVFKAGNDITTFSIGQFKFGIMICFDIRFPEISRQYVNEDCDGIIIASAFPFPRLDHWRSLLKSRAIENQMYIIAANRVGQDASLWFLGNSCIIDPWGTVKATANETEEVIIVHDIDLKKVKEAREAIPCKASYCQLINKTFR